MKVQVGVGARKEPAEGGVRIDQMALISAISNALTKQHKKLTVNPRQYNAVIAAANLVVEAFAKPDVKATPGMGLMAWLESDDVGVSSRYMAHVLAMKGCAPEFGYPHDPDDLGRCIRLVQAVPEIRRKIKLMAEHGKQWAAVAANWDRWEAMYEDPNDDGTALFKEMLEAYR